jgi:hypothetical protein
MPPCADAIIPILAEQSAARNRFDHARARTYSKLAELEELRRDHDEREREKDAHQRRLAALQAVVVAERQTVHALTIERAELERFVRDSGWSRAISYREQIETLREREDAARRRYELSCESSKIEMNGIGRSIATARKIQERGRRRLSICEGELDSLQQDCARAANEISDCDRRISRLVQTAAWEATLSPRALIPISLTLNEVAKALASRDEEVARATADFSLSRELYIGAADAGEAECACALMDAAFNELVAATALQEITRRACRELRADEDTREREARRRIEDERLRNDDWLLGEDPLERYRRRHGSPPWV